MKRRIAVFTGTRAEYGLLYWLMKGIAASPALELQVVAGAMHFSPEFGETWRQIEADGFAIDARIESLLSSDSRVGVIKSLGLGVIGMADALDGLRPDALVVLGDRFEALGAAQAALIMGVPLIHLHGGEISEGAYDDSIRHAITKLATLHFTATDSYRNRVIQMGEDPERVFNFGALGLDHILGSAPMPWDELCTSLDFSLRSPYFLVTYHPVTAADEPGLATANALFSALDQFPEHQLVFTYPNADNGGRAIIDAIADYASAAPERIVAVPSLGFRRYLAVIARADAVVGNSSSGIIEAPSFGVPTVNIGARQQGRIAAPSVLHCSADAASIATALHTALSSEHRALAARRANPYGAGGAAAQIVSVLEQADLSAPKRFHDLELLA